MSSNNPDKPTTLDEFSCDYCNKTLLIQESFAIKEYQTHGVLLCHTCKQHELHHEKIRKNLNKNP